MTSLTERLRAMLAETESERSSLESRRAELAAERDSRIDAIRTEYAEKLTALDADLAMVKRIERALEPPESRQARQAPPQRTRPVTEVPKWRPTNVNLRAVLAAIETGHETVSTITEVVDVSRGTVDNAIGTLRSDGMIRLAGTIAANEHGAKARAYKLTPAGIEFLNANRGTVGNGAHAQHEMA